MVIELEVRPNYLLGGWRYLGQRLRVAEKKRDNYRGSDDYLTI